MSWKTIRTLKVISFMVFLISMVKSNTLSIIPGAHEDVRWFWPLLISVVVFSGLVLFVEKKED